MKKSHLVRIRWSACLLSHAGLGLSGGEHAQLLLKELAIEHCHSACTRMHKGLCVYAHEYILNILLD